MDAYGTTSQAYVYTGNGLTLNGQNSSFTQYTGTYGSKDLGWEKSYNWNVGLDYGILNNRVDGSIEWFKTTTKGLLFKRTLPITSGLTGWGSHYLFGRILLKLVIKVWKSPLIHII